jgi:alkylation response protein AidB-like acyl-CoA dehydrogenase
MRFALSDDQSALRDAVRALLQDECPPAVVRAAWSDPGAGALPLWAKLVDMGLAGAAVPATAGGLGLGACDVVPLLEEAGRAAAPLPILETAFVAGPLLAAAPAGTEVLERLLAGELLVACSLDGSGVVPYAEIADLLLLSEGAGDGLPIRLLDARGVSEPVSSIDAARAVGRVSDQQAFMGLQLELEASDRVAAWRRGVVGCAAQLVGLARTLLDQTVAYVKDRRQFGVPVGSFQAVKHHLADGLIAHEFAWPAVLRAAWSIDQGLASSERDVAMAKALASEAAERVAGIALQCHGAIAYTTEYDLHLFAKRVWASARTWGGAEWQRGRVAAALGLETGLPRGASSAAI